MRKNKLLVFEEYGGVIGDNANSRRKEKKETRDQKPAGDRAASRKAFQVASAGAPASRYERLPDKAATRGLKEC